MNKFHIIVSAISIALMVIVGGILFSHPELISVNDETILNPTHNFVKNLVITLFCGAAVYTVCYGIPHEYKVANKK